jgi:hypothetical protein
LDAQQFILKCDSWLRSLWASYHGSDILLSRNARILLLNFRVQFTRQSEIPLNGWGECELTKCFLNGGIFVFSRHWIANESMVGLVGARD